MQKTTIVYTYCLDYSYMHECRQESCKTDFFFFIPKYCTHIYLSYKTSDIHNAFEDQNPSNVEIGTCSEQRSLSSTHVQWTREMRNKHVPETMKTLEKKKRKHKPPLSFLPVCSSFQCAIYPQLSLYFYTPVWSGKSSTVNSSNKQEHAFHVQIRSPEAGRSHPTCLLIFAAWAFPSINGNLWLAQRCSILCREGIPTQLTWYTGVRIRNWSIFPRWVWQYVTCQQGGCQQCQNFYQL